MKHLAVIMDGNGRWAEEKSRPRKEGHIAGAKAFIQSVKDFLELDLEYLTVFAFSTENNNREKTEVDGILEVVNFYLKQEIMPLLYRYPFKVRFIGDKKGLPMELVETMDNLTKINETCSKMVIIALNYGGINEVVRACNKIDGEITEEKLLDSLDTSGFPNPEAVVRYGGYKRLSNFMPMQTIYSELFFLDKYWPDYDKQDFINVIEEMKNIKRNFGEVKR